MRRFALLMLTMGLWVTACQPQAPEGTGEVPSPLPPTSTAVPPVDLTPAQVAVLGTLSDALGLPLEQIKIVSTEAVDWSDSCLGIIHANLGCAEMITPGFRIILEANQLQYEYHTNQAGQQIAGATLSLTWHREGGLAGFCDDVQIYLSGEVFGSSCKGGGAAYPVGQLSVVEMKQLADWARAFGPVVVQSKDPAIADALALQLTFNGSGPTTATEADKTALFNFAQTVYAKVKPCC